MHQPALLHQQYGHGRAAGATPPIGYRYCNRSEATIASKTVLLAS